MQTQKPPRQDYIDRSRFQDDGNDGASSPIELVEKSYNLPALPWTDAVLTDENSRRFYCFNLLADGGVPKASGSNIRFIQPRFDFFLGKFLRNIADGWLILAIVTQEYIKDYRFGVLCIHSKHNSIGETCAEDNASSPPPRSNFLAFRHPDIRTKASCARL